MRLLHYFLQDIYVNIYSWNSAAVTKILRWIVSLVLSMRRGVSKEPSPKVIIVQAITLELCDSPEGA
jgi:hypothetical protein